MALLLCGAGGNAPTQTTEGLITGHVYRGNTGEPLVDAVVTLVSRSSQRHQIARTASDGSYRFRDLDPGQYNMAAYKPKFLGELYGLEPGGEMRGAVLQPDRSIYEADFHLLLSPAVSAMKDDAFESLYTANERLSANFSSGAFSDGRYFAVVVGDIVTGDPEQAWRYDLQTGELRAITERPTEATSPVVRDLLWKGNSLYVTGRLRMKDRGFTVIATGGDIHETDVAPTEVKNFFANRARAEESDTSGVGPPLKIGTFVVKGEALHGGDTTWRARQDGTTRAFIVASAIHGSPVFLDNPTMAFYETGSAWRGNIVAFDMESGHSQTLSLPTGLTTLLAAKQETDGFLLAYSVAGSCTVTENSEGEDLYLLGQVLAYHGQPTVTHVCFVHFPYQYRAR
jgi:hypothetical protein